MIRKLTKIILVFLIFLTVSTVNAQEQQTKRATVTYGENLKTEIDAKVTVNGDVATFNFEDLKLDDKKYYPSIIKILVDGDEVNTCSNINKCSCSLDYDLNNITLKADYTEYSKAPADLTAEAKIHQSFTNDTFVISVSSSDKEYIGLLKHADFKIDGVSLDIWNVSIDKETDKEIYSFFTNLSDYAEDKDIVISLPYYYDAVRLINIPQRYTLSYTYYVDGIFDYARSVGTSKVPAGETIYVGQDNIISGDEYTLSFVYSSISSNNIRKEDNIYLTQMPAGDLNIVVYYKTQTKKKTETETANMDEAISVAKNEGTVIKNSDDQVISIDRSNLNDLFIFVEDVEDDEALEFIGEIAEYKKKLHQTVKDIVGYSLKPTAVCDGQKVNFGKFSEKIDYYLRLDDRTVELINNSDDIMLIEYVDDEINFLSKNDYEISDDKRSIHLSSDNFGDLFIVGMDNYNIKYESHNSSITLRTANIQTADKLVADGELKIKDKSYKISSLRPIYDYYDDSKYAFLYIDISDLEVEAGSNSVEYVLDGKAIYSSTINYPFLHTFQTYADNKLFEEEIIKLEAGFPYTIFVPKQLEGGYLLERIVHNLEDNLFRVIENDEGYIYQFYIPEYNISFKTFYSSSAYKEEMSKEELLIELNDTGKQIILYDENGNVLDNNTKITKVHIDKDKIDSVDADIDADMKELISNKIIDSSPLYFDIDFYLMEDSGNKYYSDDLKKDFNIYLDLSDEEYDKLAKNEFVVVRMHTDKDGKISYDKVDATLIPSLKQLKITSDKYSTFAVYTIEKYKFLEGENSSWTINSDKALSFRADGDFNSFESVKIDGKVVESANYDVESGSTIVSLKKEYLNTLSVGTHTITIVFNDGECSANFEIQKNTSNSSSVSARKPVPNTSVR